MVPTRPNGSRGHQLSQMGDLVPNSPNGSDGAGGIAAATHCGHPQNPLKAFDGKDFCRSAQVSGFVIVALVVALFPLCSAGASRRSPATAGRALLSNGAAAGSASRPKHIGQSRARSCLNGIPKSDNAEDYPCRAQSQDRRAWPTMNMPQDFRACRRLPAPQGLRGGSVGGVPKSARSGGSGTTRGLGPALAPGARDSVGFPSPLAASFPWQRYGSGADLLAAGTTLR